MSASVGFQIDSISRELQHSEYDWANMTLDGRRVGKARCLIEGTTIIIYSINIFPEFAGHGHGRAFVAHCQNRFRCVVADRVRPTAIGFWQTMGFEDQGDGTWEFRANSS